jgi:hypothetical protein
VRFRDDTRGVTVQIGAVLFFATVIVALSLYQATVVPSQNADVEYRHSQTVQGDMVDVRNSLLEAASTGNAKTASVKLGTQYPSRVFLMNPPPATGTLSTGSYENNTIRVSNVQATKPETRDYINGSWSAPTKYLSYTPNYNEYDGAPSRIYEASLLYNHYDEANVPLTDQLLVNGDTITLVALNGSMSTSQSGTVSVSASPVSAPTRSVQVENTSTEPINISIPTRLSSEDILNNTNLGDNSNVTVTEVGQNRVIISLPRDEYTLQTARVDVGSQQSDLGEHYLTVVDRDDDEVTVEARDRFNNPVSGVRVNASSGLNPEYRRTGVDGQATFEFADGATGEETIHILDNSSRKDRVQVSVPTGSTTENGSGAYNVQWLETLSQNSNNGLTCQNVQGCELDASVQTAVTLFADSTPTADGGIFEFAVSNTSVGTVSPPNATTSQSGQTSTTFTAERNGTVYAYVSSGGSGDRLEIRVTNFPGVVYNNDAQTGFYQSSLQFSVTNNKPDDAVVTDIRVDPVDSSIARLDDPEPGFGQYQSEFYMRTPNDGDEYTTDFGNGRSIPRTFDLSNGQPGTDSTHLIESGETAEYTLYQFQDSNNDPVDMTGKEVEITLYFQDGTQTTFTLNGDGSGEGSPSVDTFQTTDTSKTGGNPKYAQFDVEWAVSDESAVQTVDLTMTRVSDGQQVDSESMSVSGGSASGTTTLRGPDQNPDPSGQQYEITITVTDDEGQTTTQTTTVTV